MRVLRSAYKDRKPGRHRPRLRQQPRLNLNRIDCPRLHDPKVYRLFSPSPKIFPDPRMRPRTPTFHHLYVGDRKNCPAAMTSHKIFNCNMLRLLTILPPTPCFLHAPQTKPSNRPGNIPSRLDDDSSISTLRPPLTGHSADAAPASRRRSAADPPKPVRESRGSSCPRSAPGSSGPESRHPTGCGSRWPVHRSGR